MLFYLLYEENEVSFVEIRFEKRLYEALLFIYLCSGVILFIKGSWPFIPGRFSYIISSLIFLKYRFYGVD